MALRKKEQSKGVARPTGFKPSADSAAKPLRPIRFSSFRCLKLSKTVWGALMISLPLDFVLIYLPLMLLPSHDDAEAYLWVAMLVAFLLSFREKMLHLISALREKRDALLSKSTLWIVGVIVAITLIELVPTFMAHPSLNKVVAILVVFVVVGVGALRSIREIMSHRDALVNDRLFWTEQANIFHLVAVVGSSLAARSVSFFGMILAIRSEQIGAIYAPAFIVALMLLFATEPKQLDFMGRCRKCFEWTSRALLGLGYCPACAPEKFAPAEPSKQE